MRLQENDERAVNHLFGFLAGVSILSGFFVMLLGALMFEMGEAFIVFDCIFMGIGLLWAVMNLVWLFQD